MMHHRRFRGESLVHWLWHRNIYRQCLLCRFKWWRLSRRPEVKAFLRRVDVAMAEAHADDLLER